MSNQQYGPPPQQYGGPPGPPPQQYWGPPQGPPQQGPPQGPPPQYGPPQYGPPPGGPGFGFGGNGYPPPKKKRSKAPFIVVPLVLLFAGVLSLYLFALHLKQQRNNYSSPSPTYSQSSSTPAPEWNPSSSRPTATQPTQAQPTQPRPTQSTPPPPSDVDLTARNKFYKTGVQKSVNCRPPALPYTSEANARKNYATVMACLNKAWPAQVRAAGVEWQGVKLASYWGTGYSPCGQEVQRSFYCGSNKTIYMDAKTDVDNWKKFTNYPAGRNFVRARGMHVTSHEFGHHLQKITGILSAQSRLQYDLNRDKALEMNRRMEIQASCFGNVFMGANRTTMISGPVRKELVWISNNSGDEYDTVRDHGSKQIQPYWANRGYSSRNLAMCNTFTASPRYVR